MSHVLYTSAVGSIMYAMMCTRSDISHAVWTGLGKAIAK